MIPSSPGGLDGEEGFRIVPAEGLQGRNRAITGMAVRLSWDDFHRLNALMYDKLPRIMAVTQTTSPHKLYTVSERDQNPARRYSDWYAVGRVPLNIP